MRPRYWSSKIIKDLPTVSGPEEARSFVDARITEDADYIKIILDPGGTPCLFSFETIQALVDAAHSHNKRVFAHVEKGEAARLFIEAGGDVLAHVLNDLKPDSNFIDKLIQNKVFVIPTLRVSALYTAEGKEGRQKLLDHPLFNPYLDPQTRQILSQDTGNIISRFDFEGAKRTTKALHEAGVPILAGTDATPGIPVQQNAMSNLAGHGIPLHQELELLVQAGLTPSEALASATSVPAHCFGLSDRGRITRGLRADLLLVNGDPTHDIKVSREIIAIWRSGFRFDREAYRKRIESK
jgi:imidazolonepropionase-like amidohydrolase